MMGGSYDPSLFADLAALEEGNFWFAARNRIITSVLARFFPTADSFLEVGCGTGFVLAAVAATFPRLELKAIDMYPEALDFVRARVPAAEVSRADIARLDGTLSADVIGAFDVLEHIPDDEGALRSIAGAVRAGGGAIFTVPQHPWLWSGFDRASQHERRYGRGELERKVAAAGLSVVYSTSFVSLLFPFIASRRLRRGRTLSVAAELRRAASVNGILDSVMRFEALLMRRGVRFPVGGSRLVVARRVG